MFCSISGNVPDNPVVSSKSGHLFERKLVEKYVRETGKCPITGEELSLDDLLPVKANKSVKPRTAPATSVPGLLGIFHDEWDALMLETHTLRQGLHSVRQELSHALYQHDAACRVIARLIKERDDARASLEDAKNVVLAEQAAKQQRAATEEAAADQPPGKKARVAGIPEPILQELMEFNAQLSKGRKKRALPPTLATPDDFSAMSLEGSHPLHKTTQGGIVSVDTHPLHQNIVATAGLDATAKLFDYAANKQLASLEGHAKRLTGIQYASDSCILTSSADKTSRIWRQQQDLQWTCASVLKDHQAEVVGVTLHPSRKYFVTGSADASWCFYDLETASCLKQVVDDSVKEAYTTLQFHPDGLILGTATDKNMIRVWEVRQQKNVASFADHTSPVTSLAFSENGYHMASAAADGVKLWDLRKLKVFKTLTPYEDTPCNTVGFDYSGQYLAVGGADARVYGQKQDWSVVRNFPDMPKKGVLSVKLGTDARTLLVGASDHNLRVFTAPLQQQQQQQQQ